VFDVDGVSTADGALIHLWAYGGGANQQWLPQSLGGNNYRLLARHSGKCIDVPNSSTADSVQLQHWTCNGTNAQAFTITP
jgi:Ricin-type beta-trefoil lectin domain-like